MGRYLVTGCAGFIASNVCRQLLRAGHQVLGIDNLNDAYDPRLKAWRLTHLQHQEGFQFVQADVADRHSLESVLQSSQPINAIINLAARAGVRPSMLDPWIYYETNVMGTLNVLELGRKVGVGKFVLASSSSVYGDSSQIPYQEDQPVNRPVSPYAASKQASETLAYSFHQLYGLDISMLRYFTVYGPAGRPDMSVFRFVRAIAEQTPLILWGDGEQRRDFTYVDDIARGTILSLKPVGYEIFNLGSDRPYRLNEMLDILSHLLGRRPVIERRPAHPADVQQTWADITKAKALLAWESRTSFEEGLRACVDWYLEHRDFASQLELGD